MSDYATPLATPWLNLAEGAAYEKRGKRWLRNEVKAGRCRAAVIGGKRELMFRREWLDQHLEDMATPVMLPARRRA
jgi:hypothetical protein